MKTLRELELELKAQKKIWLESTTIWSDFSDDFETGMRQHKEAIEFDFLTENDKTDHFENSDLMGHALDLRAEYLQDTIVALDLA